MKRIIILVALLLTACPGGRSQDWSDVTSDRRNIWAEGWGTSVEEADRQALSALVSRITVTVSSDFRQVEQQRTGTRGSESSVELSSTLRSYSGATLSNTHRMVLKTGRRAHVVRWIREDELDAVFADRRDRAVEYEREAVKAEREGRIGDALRCHWWSYTLVRSLRRPAEAKDSQGRILMNLIPEEVNDLLEGLEVRCAGRSGQTLALRFTCRGKSVAQLDFSYFDGTAWVHGARVQKGEASVEMARGALCEHVQLRIEYAYLNEARIDAELFDIMSVLDSVRLRKSSIIFRVGNG